MSCKVFQILKIDHKNASKSCFKSPHLYDVYVEILQDKGDTSVCKVIYYKERPKIFSSVYVGKHIELNKKLLIPTEVFPKYRNNVTNWVNRVNEFNKYDNIKEVAKDALSKVKASVEDFDVMQLIISSLDADISNSNSEVTAVSTKRVYITEKMVKTGRVFISKQHKIRIDKVVGKTVWYTMDGDLKNPVRTGTMELMRYLNQNMYEVYPFWIEVMKDIQRILKPYLGLNVISWVIKWILDKLGVEQ